MKKVFGRIGYALLAGFIFVACFYYASTAMFEKYINVYGEETLNSTSSEKFLFFYGPVGYHKKTAMKSFVSNGVELHIFEVNKLMVNEQEEFKVDEFVYIVVYNGNEPIYSSDDMVYIVSFVTSELDEFGENVEIMFRIQRFRQLDVSMPVNENGEALISKDALVNKNIIRVEVKEWVYENPKVFLSETTEIKEEDFQIKEPLLLHYKDNDTLQGYGIYPKIEYDAKEYGYIMAITMSIYGVLLIGVTYFVFFHHKRVKLGRVKPSEHFDKK